MDEQTQKSAPLWKQLLGATVGSLLALMVYGGYKFTSTHLDAYLTIPWVSPHKAPSGEIRETDNASEAAQKRLAERARQIAEEFSVRNVYVPDAEAPEEETEPSVLSPETSAPEPAAVPMQEPAPEPVMEQEIQPVEASLQKAEPPELPSSGIGLPLVTVFAFLAAIALRYRKVLEQPLW